MTVNTDTAFNSFTGNGAQTAFPFTFIAASSDEVGAVIGGAEQTAGFSVAVSPSGTGTVTFASAPLVSAEVLLYSKPRFTQPVAFQRFGPYFPDAINPPLDRLTKLSIYLKARVDRLFSSTFLSTSAVAGRFSGWDAAGNPVALSGTGTDGSFRTDFASSIGASLGKAANGLTIQANLDIALFAQTQDARRKPPYSGNIDCFDCWPAPVVGFYTAIKRISGFYFLVRVLRPTGLIEEFVVQDSSGSLGPYYTDQIVSHRTYWRNFVQDWLLQPATPGTQTATRFAWRAGLSTDAFATVEANACEIGITSRTDTPTAPTIKLNGVGANLQPLANWPAGTTLWGDFLTIDHTYRLKMPTGAWGISMASSMTFDSPFGLREITTASALIANVVIQNSPGPMLATHKGSFATHCKLRGPATIGPFFTPTTVPLVDDGEQKGNWRKYDMNVSPTTGIPGGSAAQDTLYFYNPALDLRYQIRAGKGPWMQNFAETKTPWQDCGYGAAHITDQGSLAGFAKAVVYVHTTTDGGTNQLSLPMGNPHQIYTFRSVEVGGLI